MSPNDGRLQRLLTYVRDWEYLRKWIVLGALIGVVAGLAAIAFIFALDLATAVLLEGIGGYEPPLPIGEGNRLAEGELTRPWAVPLVVGLGGLISGVLVFGFAPEAEGHGTDAAIAAIHHRPRSVRGRVTLIKLLASAATIGSGGSAGREGPTAQISAGFGSLLARRLDLSPQDARIAVTVGVGAGIGAIFRAPLGGAVLGTETTRSRARSSSRRETTSEWSHGLRCTRWALKVMAPDSAMPARLPSCLCSQLSIHASSRSVSATVRSSSSGVRTSGTMQKPFSSNCCACSFVSPRKGPV